MQWRGATTERLADVIRIVQLARKTGVLVAERGGEGRQPREEGTVTFIEGQVTDAKVNHLNGSAAFNVLSNWGACRFSFNALPEQSASSSPYQISPSSGSLPAVRPGRNSPPQGRGGVPQKPGPRTQPPSGGAIPRRLRHPDEVLPYFEYLGLTRVHRRLFLLIDGQRSTSELVYLLGRNQEEVLKLLADLQVTGLIQQ